MHSSHGRYKSSHRSVYPIDLGDRLGNQVYRIEKRRPMHVQLSGGDISRTKTPPVENGQHRRAGVLSRFLSGHPEAAAVSESLHFPLTLKSLNTNQLISTTLMSYP